MFMLLSIVLLVGFYYLIKVLVKNGKIKIPIIKDLFTAARGGATEVGEALVSVNSIRILKQQIVDVDECIDSAKGSLADLRVRESTAIERIDYLKKVRAERRDKIKSVLVGNEQGNTNILAEEIIECDQIIEREEALVSNINEQKNKLEKIIERSTSRIKKMKYRTRICEINTEVIEIQEKIGESGGKYVCANSKLDGMSKTLAKVEEQQKKSYSVMQERIKIEDKYSSENKLISYTEDVDEIGKEEKIGKILNAIAEE